MNNFKLITAVLAAAVLLFSPAMVKAEKIKITFSHENAVGGLVDQTAHKFKELLEAKTDKVEVSIHPAAQLGDDQQNMEGMKLGTIQMSMGNPDYLAKRVPEFVVFTLPYMFSGWEHVEKAMDSDVAKELTQTLIKEKGIRILMWGHNGFRNMITAKKKINSMADFKGVKFRSPAIPVYVKMFKAIGANPTPIPWPEAYNALRMGIVDGLEGAPEAFVASKMYEIAKYITMTNHLYTAMLLLIDENFYQGLPADARKAVDEAAAELQPWQRQMVKKATGTVYETLEGKGVTVSDIDTTEMQNACKPVWKELASGAKAQKYADTLSSLK